MIENLREQKDREDRVRLEEMEQLRKENHELKDKLLVVQPQKLLQNQLSNPSPSQNQRPDGEVSTGWCYKGVWTDVSIIEKSMCVWYPGVKS